MRSMTGYASKEYQDSNIMVSIDLKAYNNKFLDLSLNIPVWLNPLEGKIRSLIMDKGIKRGRVDIFLRVKELTEDIEVYVDESIVKKIVLALKSVAKASGVKSKPDLSYIASYDGVLKTKKERDLDGIWSILEVELNKLIDDFIIDKENEGRNLNTDILGCLNNLYSSLEVVEKHSPEIEAKIKSNFKERFTEVLGTRVDEDRILQELGVLLVKYDINEEIVRLKSHKENFINSCKEIPCGKKLDFICQEMNREINTIGSKTPIIEVSRAVVDMKNELEKIREQVRNVE